MFTIAAASAYSGNSLVSDFNVWKVTHSKKYETSSAEASALAAFSSNDAIIKEHNEQKLSYELGHNQFSDMTWDEFKFHVMGGGFHRNYSPKNSQRVFIKTEKAQADAVDWVAKGAVTAVKDQARCGSCWAFSTTGSVEGGLFVNEGKLLSLSEQDLVSCDHNGDQGCKGGLMDHAFEWIEKNGICSEIDYPYTSGAGASGTCKSPACSPAVTLTKYVDVAHNDAALKDAITKQPVSVAIEADKSAFQLYKSGVLDSSACGTQLDHGVLAVGYGTDSDSGKDYYKVKNSWGATWGENGYIRMVQGKNMCGITQSASYPTGVKSMAPGPSPGPSPPSPSPPTPPAPSTSHYGDPAAGCMSDEQSITIQGIEGDFCSPACTGLLHMKCPSDVPAGVTATPACALKDSASGSKYCALECSPTEFIADQKAADAQCGTNASCKPIQGVGLCTYND